MSGKAGQLQHDAWHREAKSLTFRNNIQLRRWGMRVTVFGTVADDGDYVLEYNLSSTNRQDNGNWLKVADIGQTWGGGGGGSYVFGQGLFYAPGFGNLVGIGGNLNGASTINTTGGTLNIVSDINIGGRFSNTLVEIFSDNVNFAIGNNFAFLQGNDPTFVGLQYAAVNDDNLVGNSLTSKSYVDTRIGGQQTNINIQAPAGAEDGYAITWDFGSQEYRLSPVGMPVSYTFENGVTDFGGGTTIGLGGNLTGFTTIGINGLSFALEDSATNTYFAVSAGSIYADGNAAFPGIQYGNDYAANFVSGSLVNYGYVNTHLGGQLLDTTVTSPGAGQNGYVLSWDNTNLEYTLVPQSGGGGVNFGTVRQVPYMNATNNNFDYEAGYEYDQATNTLSAPIVYGTATVLSGNGFTYGLSSAGAGSNTYSMAPGGTALNLSLRFAVRGTGIFDFISQDWENGIIFDELGANNNTTIYQRTTNNVTQASSFRLIGGSGINGVINGHNIELVGGPAYGVAGNGNGGNTLITSGAKRAAGTGLDGNIILNALTGFIQMVGLPVTSVGLPANTVWNNAGTLSIT